MTLPPGNYNLQYELNTMSPVMARLKFGDWVARVNIAINAMAVQQDITIGLASGSVVQASGTLTVAGTATAGNTYTVQFVNPGTPSLVTPGLTLSGTVVTGSVNNTAAQIAAQINANQILSAAGITASNPAASAVVTVRQPGLIGNGLVMTTGVVGAVTVTSTALTSGTGVVVARSSLNTIQLLNTIP